MAGIACMRKINEDATDGQAFSVTALNQKQGTEAFTLNSIGTSARGQGSFQYTGNWSVLEHGAAIVAAKEDHAVAQRHRSVL